MILKIKYTQACQLCQNPQSIARTWQFDEMANSEIECREIEKVLQRERRAIRRGRERRRAWRKTCGAPWRGGSRGRWRTIRRGTEPPYRRWLPPRRGGPPRSDPPRTAPRTPTRPSGPPRPTTWLPMPPSSDRSPGSRLSCTEKEMGKKTATR